MYHSEIVEKMLKDMENDPWYVKLKRWIKLRYWVFYCMRIRPIRHFFGLDEK